MSKFQGREKNKYNYLAQYTPTTQWNNDKIPPLISLNTKAQIKQSQISIQSINQSEVKSVYTIDKEDFDKQVLDILNPSTDRTFREARTEKNIKNIRSTQTDNKSYETPVNFSKQKIKMESKVEEIAKKMYEYNQNEYEKCNAVNLYCELVEQNLQKHLESQQNERRELEWMKAKSPTEMLASVLTNPSRMDLYVHSILKEIHLNEKAKIINQLHQQEIEPYNPTLKSVYTDILCLLTKINTSRTKKYYLNHQNNPERGKSSSKQKQIASISLFQNGLQIDLNPKLTAVRKQNAEKIRELKQKISQTQQQMQDTKKIYEEIILNFAMTIQNLNKGQEPEGTLHSPLQQSSVRLLIDEQQDEIRKKNHTFGMKDFTRRPSKNLK